MIRSGTKITLRPYKTYKDDPSKNVDIECGECEEGKYLQCQVMDVNVGNSGKITGFFYVRIFTELPLAINDIVTVKDILWVQKKRNVCVLGCTIYEGQVLMSNSDFKDVGF